VIDGAFTTWASGTPGGFIFAPAELAHERASCVDGRDRNNDGDDGELPINHR
jgi:hypothetical protein